MKTLYYNAMIITMNNKNIENAMIVDDETIIEVGNIEELKTKEHDQEVDVQGKVILPGFIDGHSHFMAMAMTQGQCDVSHVKSQEELIQTIQTFMNKPLKENQWIQAIGLVQDHDYPIDRYVLDKISTQYPILVAYASGHMGIMNSKGLELMQLDENSTVEGGRFLKNENGLTGYLEENAFIETRKKIPADGIDTILEYVKNTQQIYASNGITTIQEGMVEKQLFQLLMYLNQLDAMYLDLIGYFDLASCPELIDQISMLEGKHIKIGGAKIFLDGSPQGKTAWMETPYLNTNDYGYPTMKDEQVYHLVCMALKHKLQLLAHCNGDAAARQYINAFKKAIKDYPETYRPVMVHCQLLREDQMQEMYDINMIASFFVAHVYHYGDIHIQNFGYDRAKDISSVNSAIKHHLHYTFHQDCPVMLPKMFETLWIACTRKTKAGVQLNVDECIDIYDALKAITIDGAYQYHQEDIKGTIEKGKLADFIIVDKNPLTISIDDIKDIQILQTYKNGTCIYEKS